MANSLNMLPSRSPCLSFSISLSSTSSRVEQAGRQAADACRSDPEADAAHGALERGADLAVDQPDRQVARFGAVHRRLHLGARLDAELVGQAALERRQRQVGRDHAGLALADDLEQVEIAERFRIAHRLVARLRTARPRPHRRIRARGFRAPPRRWRARHARCRAGRIRRHRGCTRSIGCCGERLALIVARGESGSSLVSLGHGFRTQSRKRLSRSP